MIHWVPLALSMAGGSALAAQNVTVLRAPLELEDKPLIEAAGQRMGGAELFSLKPVLLPGDAAAVCARRLLQGLIDRERA